MSIYRTKQGFGVDYRDEFNRRRRRFVGQEQAARILLNQLRQSAQQAREALLHYRQAQDLDLETARDLYISSMGTNDRNRERARKRLTFFIKKLGNVQAGQVTPQILAEWHKQRSQEAAPQTVANDCLLMRRWFRFLKEHWNLPSCPAEELDCKTRRTLAALPLSHEEELQIIRRITLTRQWLKFLLGIDAGLRSGEVALLRNGRVNMTGKEITVIPSKPGQPRVVPMTERLREALRAYGDPTARDPDALVFQHLDQPIKRPWSPLTVLHTTPGVARRRFHDLRHTFASRLAAIGVQPHAIRALLGHAPFNTTDEYLHASDTELHAAIADLEKFNSEMLKQAAGKDTEKTEQEITKELS